jgi:Ca2+-binding EF-hand superfamily protein
VLNLEDAVIKEIIATVDDSGDGIVQFDEFKRMMLSL